jgi:hypothetical protein
MRVSKTMEEVWRWKEEIAKEIEGMTSQQRIAYYSQADQKLAEKTGKEKLNLRRLVRPHKQRENGGS